MPYTSTSSGVSVTAAHKESPIGHPEFEVGKVFGVYDSRKPGRGHPIRMNQWSDQQDGEKQMPGSDDGMPQQREQREMPNDQRERKPNEEGQPSMNTHSGNQQKEGSGSTRQGDQERQTPEKEDLMQRRSGRRNEIRSGIEIRTVYEQNSYLFA